MGYYGSTTSDKKQFLKELKQDHGSAQYIKGCVRGNLFWSIWLNIESGLYYIKLDILRKVNGLWCNKPLVEGDYPFYYSCPLSYLKIANTYICEDWRTKVKEYHNQ